MFWPPFWNGFLNVILVMLIWSWSLTLIQISLKNSFGKVFFFCCCFFVFLFCFFFQMWPKSRWREIKVGLLAAIFKRYIILFYFLELCFSLSVCLFVLFVCFCFICLFFFHFWFSFFFFFFLVRTFKFHCKIPVEKLFSRGFESFCPLLRIQKSFFAKFLCQSNTSLPSQITLQQLITPSTRRKVKFLIAKWTSALDG